MSERTPISNSKTAPVPLRVPPTVSSFMSHHHKLQCVFCEGDHFLASCMKGTEMKDRRDILLKAGRCFNCLKLRHKSKDGDSPKNCQYCNQCHHQSICDICRWSNHRRSAFLWFERNRDKDHGDVTQNPTCVKITRSIFMKNKLMLCYF